ncbi:Uncharacterised protein [Streptococcus equi subsp. zooepidemicus]|uniref:Phage protein n=1 Tax=Streptococcus equi subsp. zooepidemicus TaxID=40041 RepID=A0AAX2LFT7_STRSZ|nr:hypothetical protein [Streptococcus equi]QTC12965.1 hypothetical protein HIEAAJJG_01734 [Streptococcus equi subsp. zooepidemicus]SQE96636.1 Uncharacterised protein [Streptococcus equi subsp. zooepidemicus]SUO81606.1 Uncharacterised protein [Streptococcus equi subsp. zooepidemicus]
MITDKDYNYISKDVYKVDSNKTNSPFRVGMIVGNNNFKILKAEDNPDNGMQAGGWSN